MTKPAIKIEGLGKRYIVDHERKGKGGGYRTLRETITDACAGALSEDEVEGSEFGARGGFRGRD